MAEHKPLFPLESPRTRLFRRLIIRKTLQIARENPRLSDEELAILAEREADVICDLCLESSFDHENKHIAGHYFLASGRDDRKEHVGRFFMHKIESHLRKGHLLDILIPIFAQSVGALLGQEAYEKFSDRLSRLVAGMAAEGKTYSEALESEAGCALTREIIDTYRAEMVKSTCFIEQLRNRIDSELVHFKAIEQNKDVDIEETIGQVYNEFLELMGLTRLPKDH